MPFQPTALPPLSGVVQPTIVIDPAVAPDVEEIVQAGTPFHVRVRWQLNGAAVALMGGTFRVQAFFEGFGNRPEPNIPAAPINIPLVPVPGHWYQVDIPVAGNALPAGAYNLVTLITYLNAAGNPGPVAGFSEPRIVQIFP
jgi:hypothetical protein